LIAERLSPMGPSVFSRFVSSTEFWFSFYERARVNVRAKGRAVNSVFLVQLRKMLDKYFGGLAWSVKIVEEVVLRRMKGVGSVWERAVEGIFRAWGQGIVHRHCTGNAETQWSVASAQWSVFRSRLCGEPR
jgi:hypothetical protein